MRILISLFAILLFLTCDSVSTPTGKKKLDNNNNKTTQKESNKNTNDKTQEGTSTQTEKEVVQEKTADHSKLEKDGNTAPEEVDLADLDQELTDDSGEGVEVPVNLHIKGKIYQVGFENHQDIAIPEFSNPERLKELDDILSSVKEMDIDSLIKTPSVKGLEEIKDQFKVK